MLKSLDINKQKEREKERKENKNALIKQFLEKKKNDSISLDESKQRRVSHGLSGGGVQSKI